jgi:hypothetical protein
VIDGSARYRTNRKRGIVDLAVSLRDADSDRVDAAAELFVGRRYGIADQVQTSRPTPCDFRVDKAHLDVKHTNLLHGGLLRYAHTGRRAEHWCTAYLLVVGPEDDFRMAGWEWGHILRESWRADLPRPAYYIAQDKLRPNVDILMAATFSLGVHHGPDSG